VSTAISSGAIIGIGLHRSAETICWDCQDMLLAWVVTCRVSLDAAGAFALLR
jgi:phosphate/sulfate permease